MKALTSSEMAALDKAMVTAGIDALQMMELAGLLVAGAAAQVSQISTPNKRGKILVLSGSGNNGGDALVAARHLLNWGWNVDVLLATPSGRLKELPARQWSILKKMGMRQPKKSMGTYGLIIDGLLGYSLKGSPKGSIAKLIEQANASKIPILSVDVPSGLDGTTGKPLIPCIRAKATVAIGAPKTGLLKKEARPYVGQVYVSYLGIPARIARRFGLKQVFSQKALIFRLAAALML